MRQSPPTRAEVAMLWIIFLALLTIVVVMTVAAVRGLEVDRTTSTRFLAGSFFLVLAFVGLGTASFYSPPAEFPPRFLQNGGDDFLSVKALGIMGVLAGGIGLFLLVLGAVHLAQSQWRHRLDKYDEDMGRLDDPDVSQPGDRHAD